MIITHFQYIPFKEVNFIDVWIFPDIRKIHLHYFENYSSMKGSYQIGVWHLTHKKLEK
jgi:hypothetical protein